ncbi:hypothetical protein [Glycomyces tenuis]|uniref:hypothetical protein n=1 Tax=Glycomyces tenuis TaxID=58116 RepID=UPI00041DD261|nr:hypothetical protein [Glycomyces tenuis]
MRNSELERLDGLLGTWKLTLSDAWFLEPEGTEVYGSAVVEWLGDAFVVVRSELDGELEIAIGRSDARDAYTALYHDDRGVCRVFAMTFDGSHWTLSREDPDFHQRFVADVEPDRIAGRWEASEDEGATWRKDFDLTFERTNEP